MVNGDKRRDGRGKTHTRESLLEIYNLGSLALVMKGKINASSQKWHFSLCESYLSAAI